MTGDDSGTWVNVAVAARLTRVNEATIRVWADRGHVRTRERGRARLYRLEDVREREKRWRLEAVQRATRERRQRREEKE